MGKIGLICLLSPLIFFSISEELIGIEQLPEQVMTSVEVHSIQQKGTVQPKVPSKNLKQDPLKHSNRPRVTHRSESEEMQKEKGAQSDFSERKAIVEESPGQELSSHQPAKKGRKTQPRAQEKQRPALPKQGTKQSVQREKGAPLKQADLTPLSTRSQSNRIVLVAKAAPSESKKAPPVVFERPLPAAKPPQAQTVSPDKQRPSKLTRKQRTEATLEQAKQVKAQSATAEAKPAQQLQNGKKGDKKQSSKACRLGRR